MPDTRRDRLRGELARERARAGLSGRGLVAEVEARHGVHTTQATVSRVEAGHTLPSLPLVRAWLDVVGTARADADRLLDLAEAVHAETRGWAELLGDGGHTQREQRRRERDAAQAWNYQPTVIPGLLQTADYARAVFRLGRTRDVDGAVTVRLERQQVLAETGRLFRFLLAEPVLHWPVGGHGVQAAQRERLANLAGLPTVDLAIVPAERAGALAWHNFVLWVPADPAVGRFVSTELVHGEQEVHDPDLVGLYESLWARLWDAAAVGDDAVALIRRPADSA